QQQKFKVATTPDTATLEYYQSIYIHCKQRFNIPDRTEIVKRTLYLYIENCINNYLLGNYNISEVRSNLYNNLVYYSQLETEDLNSKTLATYFQELNYNIIKYCKEKYLVQSKYTFDSELKTKTSNKGKQKAKQHSKTTSNTPILTKTTAKHLQTPEQETSVKLTLSIIPFSISLAQPQTPNSSLIRFSRIEDFQLPKSLIQQQEPISTSTNLIDYLAENQSEKTESEQETEDSENEEEIVFTYIAKIPDFSEEDIETSPQEWLDQVFKAGDANGWNAVRMLRIIPYFFKGTAEKWFENLAAPFNDWDAFKAVFFKQFIDNNTSITLRNQFHNIKQKFFKSVMTYLEKFNKLLRRICQLKTNDYYSNIQILDQFITGLKDKLIKKVRPHAPKDLNSAIQHVKRYEMAIEEANCTKLPAPQPIQQQYQQPLTQHYQVPARRLILQNQFTPQNRYQVNNNRINLNNQLVSQNSAQPRPNHYHIQSSYLIIPEEQDFCHIALSEGRAAAQQQNPFYTSTTILPAKIAKNTNLSDIFSFKFEANELPFLLSNVAANKQKAIIAMYTEAEVEKKPIRLILDSEFAESIITYQLMQQLKRNVDRPAQTIIVTADGMKKTPVKEIDNFPFTIDGITIPVKVLVMDASQYQALVGNNWLQKANANLNWETQELTISYQGQHVWVPATCDTFNKCSKKAPAFEFEPEEKKPIIETFMALGSTSNWADETKQHENDENEIEFGEPEATKEIEATPIYLIKNQPALQLKYFNNNGQEIKPKKAHEINAGYNLRYSDKDTLVLKPKSFTKINLKIAFEIPTGAMVQIAFWFSLASKEINVRGGIIDAGYTGNITVILQNETNKSFKIEHVEKIVQAIYLSLINISGLQLVNQREQLEKSDRGTQGFGSTGRFTVPVNIALNKQYESHQIL
ncbi:hypothetical protein G9A89_000727, partial [Geosiphon pyriformis]